MERVLARVVVFAMVLGSGCATLHPGEYAYTGAGQRRTGLGLVVSGMEREEVASGSLGVLDLTFENRSDRWVRIKQVRLDFGHANPSIELPWGMDLVRWHQAAAQKYAMEVHNSNLFLGVLQIAGAAALVGAGGRGPVAAGGAAVLLGATATRDVTEVDRAAKSVESSSLSPWDHLFAPAFDIPPELFAKRWVLVNTRDHARIGYVDRVDIEYETTEGVTERVRLVFRQGRCSSRWQRELCGRVQGPPAWGRG